MNDIVRHLKVFLILQFHPQELRREVKIPPAVVDVERTSTDGDKTSPEQMTHDTAMTVHSV
jgi:hypothetical protein